MDVEARPYPAWWVERARTRRALLDVAVERLKEAVRTDAEIARALIFGSYASGHVGPDSDLDVIVVTTLAADGDPGARHAEIAKRLALGVPCDLIVYGQDEFDRLANERSFFRPPESMVSGSMQQHPLDLATNWLAQAKRDLDSAEYLCDGGRYDAACFASQQAAKKALGGVLVWLAGDRPRTHELTLLVAEITSRAADAAPVLGDVAALDPYYVTTRYPDAVGGGIPGTKFFAPEARLALERAARAVAYARRILTDAAGA